MTQVDFYTHVEDKCHTAALLCGKAVERGMRVVVYAPDAEVANTIDQLLWTVSPTGFIPHCPAGDKLAPVTPVVIDRQATAFSHDDLLINLGNEQPTHFSRFQRLVEIVGMDDGDRQAARERYRFYRDRGYEIRSHDLSKKRSAG